MKEMTSNNFKMLFHGQDTLQFRMTGWLDDGSFQSIDLQVKVLITFHINITFFMYVKIPAKAKIKNYRRLRIASCFSLDQTARKNFSIWLMLAPSKARIHKNLSDH